MSYLKRDYEWYYSGSYLGLRVGGEVHPFYIEEVLWEGDTDEYGDIITDGDEDETLSMMSFYGRVSDGENTEYKTVGVTDSSLIYELPHLGVFNVRGRDVWLRYMPQRSVKKGLSDNRIYPRVSLNMDLAYQIYSRGFTRTKHQFSFVGNVVYYKGQLVVGSISENTITLSENAMYLLPMLKKQVEEINGNSTTGVLTVSTQ